MLASCEINGGIYLWDPSTGKKFRQLGTRSRCYGGFMAYSLDGKLLLDTSLLENEVDPPPAGAYIYDAASGKQLTLIKLARTAAFSSDGKMVASLTDNGVLTIWGVGSK